MAPRDMKKPAQAPALIAYVRLASGLLLCLEDLPAAVHAGLEVDVVRAAEFAGVLVLDVRRGLDGVGGAPHAAPRGRGLSFRNGHGCLPVWRAQRLAVGQAPLASRSREGAAYTGPPARTLALRRSAVAQAG